MAIKTSKIKEFLREEDISNFFSHVDKTSSCWEWTAHIYKSGYGCAVVSAKSRLAHRVSWVIHNDEIPNNLQVHHKCNNRKCVNPEHLELGTHLDNMRYMRECDRQPKGEEKAGVKLTEDCVRDIFYSSMTNRELSEIYKVSESAIAKIRRGAKWSHLDIDRSRPLIKQVAKGEKSGVSKFTEKEILEIRRSSENPKIIAKRYNVHWSSIYRIRRGDSWVHV